MQIDLVQGMMDCLYAECKPCITDCVLAELEKLGQKYRVALKVAKVRLSILQHPGKFWIQQLTEEAIKHYIPDKGLRQNELGLPASLGQ